MFNRLIGRNAISGCEGTLVLGVLMVSVENICMKSKVFISIVLTGLIILQIKWILIEEVLLLENVVLQMRYL